MCKRLLIVCLCFLFCSGCEHISKSRRASYVSKHPELSEEQKNLLLKGKLWVGMTQEEVKAVLGSPGITQKDILGEKEVWSYMYNDTYTTHRDYKFERVLRVEFIEGRLANWRED